MPARQLPNIVLHYLEHSRSQRILWLLEELGIHYTLKVYRRDAQGTPPPDLALVHPTGKAPVLEDGPLMLAESGAIVEYLISRYGKETFGISDESSRAWVDNLYYSHYAEGSVQSFIIRRYQYNRIRDQVPYDVLDSAFLASGLKKHAEQIECRLEEVESRGGWFAGTGDDRPSSADFMMSFTLETLVVAAGEYAGQKTREWVKKVQARPAYQKGLTKVGGYRFLFKEAEAQGPEP